MYTRMIRTLTASRNEALHLLLSGTLRDSAFQDPVNLEADGQEVDATEKKPDFESSEVSLRGVWELYATSWRFAICILEEGNTMRQEGCGQSTRS